MERGEEQRLEPRVEDVDPANAHRAERIAVISLGQADEARARRLAAKLPVLEGHLDADLHGRGTVVRIENLGKAGGSDLHEALCEQCRPVVGKPQLGRVFQSVHLGLDGLVDLLPAVAVDVGPDRGDAVEPAVAVGVDQP